MRQSETEDASGKNLSSPIGMGGWQNSLNPRMLWHSQKDTPNNKGLYNYGYIRCGSFLSPCLVIVKKKKKKKLKWLTRKFTQAWSIKQATNNAVVGRTLPRCESGSTLFSVLFPSQVVLGVWFVLPHVKQGLYPRPTREGGVLGMFFPPKLQCFFICFSAF